MAYNFPSEPWLKALEQVLNNDERYAEVAKKWEGDLLFIIDPDEPHPDKESLLYYLDLWHGKCRGIRILTPSSEEKSEARFILKASRSRLMQILQGELDPMQAMVTRRLEVKGDMGYMLRNVPVVLDFVRCCRQVDIED